MAAQRADPESPPPVQASLCLACSVSGLCIGSVAAETGTTQLRGVLAGRRRLHPGETLSRRGDSCLYVVRSGCLKTSVVRDDGERVLSFHFAGEVLAPAGPAGGRPASMLTALEDTDLCAIRFRPADGSAGVRDYLGRLWDMMSRELMRERADSAWFAGLEANARVMALLARLSARVRVHGCPSREFPLRLSAADIGSYLGLSDGTVSRVFATLAGRGLVEVDGYHVRIVQPERLQRAAGGVRRSEAGA